MITRDEVNTALLNFKKQFGHAAMRKLIENVAGVTAMSEIRQSDFAAVLDACKKPPSLGTRIVNDDDSEAPASGAVPRSLEEIAPRAYSRWNAAGRRAAE